MLFNECTPGVFSIGRLVITVCEKYSKELWYLGIRTGMKRPREIDGGLVLKGLISLKTGEPSEGV